MKKTLTAIALATFGAGLAPAQNAPVQSAPAPAPAPIAAASNDFAARALISWSGKNVFRGKERSSDQGLVQTSVTLEYNVPGFSGISLYGNFFNADSVERTYTAGLRKEFPIVVADLGFQHMTSPTARSLAVDGFSQLRADDEAYLGVTFLVPFKPSAYVYYSFDQQQVTAELSASKTLKGLGLGVSGYDLELKVYAGLSNAREAENVALNTNAYNYAGASLDLTREIGLGSKVGVGVNYSYNDDGYAATKGSATWFRAFASFKY